MERDLLRVDEQAGRDGERKKSAVTAENIQPGLHNCAIFGRKLCI